MTDAVYYTDSTPPAAYTGSLKTGISGTNTGIRYALFEDTATWDAWNDWATVNAYSSTGRTNYTSRALNMVGYWPTMQTSTAATDSDPDTATKSFMCITKGSTGGVCMEAIIGASENTVNTWYIPGADIATKLTTPQGAITMYTGSETLSEQTTDYLFSATTVAAPALTVRAEDPTDPTDFKAFKVANCSLTQVKMDCLNWVAKESASDTGVVKWSSGDSVTFWWFDGRQYKDNTAETLDDASNTLWIANSGTEEGGTLKIEKKFQKGTVTLAMDSGALESLVPGAAAIVALSMLFSF